MVPGAQKSASINLFSTCDSSLSTKQAAERSPNKETPDLGLRHVLALFAPSALNFGLATTDLK